MLYQPNKETAERWRKWLLRAGRGAQSAGALAQAKLFHDPDETHIRREVERKEFEPKLANAGSLERKWLRRLQPMTYPTYWKDKKSAAEFMSGEGKSVAWLCARAHGLATALAGLLPREEFDRHGKPNPGAYYFWHPVTFKNDKVGMKWLGELRAAAGEAHEWEVKWMAEILLGGPDRPGGTPEGVSDFALEAICNLRRWDGSVLRMVRLKNLLGETSEILELQADDFKSPDHFCGWALAQGTFTWDGNQTQLRALQWDVNRKTAWRTMLEVDTCGWHQITNSCPLGQPVRSGGLPVHTFVKGTCACGASEGLVPGVWFEGDCAYHNGKVLHKDAAGIYWVDGEGYFLRDKGREGAEFMQGLPMMQPERRLADMITAKDLATFINQPTPRSVAERKIANSQIANSQGRAAKFEDQGLAVKFEDKELVKALFREVGQRFNEYVVSMEGFLGVGAMLSYLVAPEVFKRRKMFPGLFVFGQQGSGKGTMLEWLMALWGFEVGAGAGNSASIVGVLQQAQNYSNHPVWIDEFRESNMKDFRPILRDALQRQPSPKWVPPDGVHRKIRTMFVVSGESTTGDAATRSRFSHIQVSQIKRKEAIAAGLVGDHYEWLTRYKHLFFVLTRFGLENRAALVNLTISYLDAWLGFEELAGAGDRDRIAHGLHWAVWMAMCELLESHDPPETAAFKQFMIEHTATSSQSVKTETHLATFWTDLVSAFNEGDIPLNCFHYETADAEYPPGQRWVSCTLYLEPNGVLSALAAYLRKRGQSVTLRRNDLQDQLSKESYWIEGKHRKRFGQEGLPGGITAWAFALDEHPLGLQRLLLADFLASLKPADPDDPAAFHHFREGDPRMGPLFAIIHKLQEREKRP